jgi:hypothetical protein
MASAKWRVTAELNALAFAVGSVCGLFPTPVMAQDDVLVEVETGRLAGVRQGTVAIFKGVPYAAPPVGPLRWQPPQRAVSTSTSTSSCAITGVGNRPHTDPTAKARAFNSAVTRHFAEAIVLIAHGHAHGQPFLRPE